jgi:translation initiation factor IF-3
MIRDDSPSAESGNTADPQQRVRLIDGKGNQLGIMTLSAAEAIAVSQGAKLVKIAPTATPPIFRLMDDETYQKLIKKRKRWSTCL